MLNRDALEGLYGFTDFTWAVYGKMVRRLPEGGLMAPVAGSGWPSLADAFRHMLGAYDGWLHERLGAGPVIVEKIEDITSWEAFEDWRVKVRASLRRVLDGGSDADLSEATASVGGAQGQSAMMSPGDVLAHVLLHERGHHGDVSTLFSSFGIEMPAMDYGVYLYFNRQA